jgi:putative molybdopterin biosynthesis protein
MSTHLEVALSVAGGKADAGIGIQSAANSCDLEFIPIAKEKFDLVIPMDNYQTPVFLDLVKMIRSEEYKRSVSEMGGYDTARTGEVEFVNSINSLR